MLLGTSHSLHTDVQKAAVHTCRAVVVVGDEQGQVGVGCASAKEVVQAVAKAVVGAKNELVRVPLTQSASLAAQTH